MTTRKHNTPGFNQPSRKTFSAKIIPASTLSIHIKIYSSITPHLPAMLTQFTSTKTKQVKVSQCKLLKSLLAIDLNQHTQVETHKD